MTRATVTLPPESRSVSQARNFLTATLDDWGMADHEWAAAQILSELATNALLHARTPFTVSISAHGRRLRVEVRDGSTRPPVRRRFRLFATNGRGIAIVERLSARWGVQIADDGKTVWCDVDPSTAGRRRSQHALDVRSGVA